jgi:cytochrome c551/c552
VAAKIGKAPQAADLMKEARATYDSMSYNERQLYVQQHLAEPAAYESADRPDAAPTLPKYADGTPRPQFVQIGPELSGVGTKLTSGRTPEQAKQWLFDWLKEPRHYSEYTIMPRLRLTDQQALDLTEYLLAQTRAATDPDDEWRAVLTPPDTPKLIEMASFFLRSRYSENKAYEKADDPVELRMLAVEALTTREVDAKQAAELVKQIEAEPNGKDTLRMLFLGKKLIGHYGCMSCHAINGTETITTPCANLSDWGQKGIDKLDFGYLDHHKLAGLPPTSKIPMVNGLSAKSTHLLDPRAQAGETASADPHGVAGTPLNGRMAHDFEVAWPHVGHNRVDWITQKLKNSRAYDRGKALLEPDPGARTENGRLRSPGKPYDKLKMPTFYLNDEQVQAIVTFVISNRDRLVSPTLTQRATDEQAALVARGRELTERYNCVSCHQVELNVPQIQQYAKPDEIATKWPPSLRGEGNKAQYDWLFNFFKNVEPLRPLLVNGIRMPSFYASDDEWNAIIAYFNAVSRKESRQLARQLDPVTKAIAADLKAANSTTQPSEAWPAQDDWWTKREFAPTAEALKNWALRRGLVRDIELDPSKNTPEQLNKTYKTMLFKARFVGGLFDAPYPFVDSGRADWGSMTPELREQHFKLGEQLFYEMQCLKCHVLGDPSVEGAQKNPTAPNLSLTYQRLQREWVRHWVQEPGVIQVGTAMPPFLTGLPVFNLHGQPWPRSQDAAPAEVQRVEQTYGDTPQKQAKLLLDFLYEAGERGYTGVQPATVGGATQTPANPGTPSAATMPAQPPKREETAAQPGAATQPATQPAKQSPTPESPGAPVPTPGKDPQSQSQEQQKKTEVAMNAAPSPGAEPKPMEAQAAPAPAKPHAADADKDAAVVGRILFKGQAPEMPEIKMAPECNAKHANPHIDESVYVNDNNTLRNVVVYVSAGLPDGESYPPPAEPAVLDQDGCVYKPHVLVMQAGQKLVIKNSDPFLHNVHSLAAVNPAFNFGQPTIDNKPGRLIDNIKAAEQFRIKCDVHPWMNAHVHVLEHPFFAVTGEDGSFAIRALPPGKYTLTAWHETLGEQKQEITVEQGKPAAAEMTFGG